MLREGEVVLGTRGLDEGVLCWEWVGRRDVDARKRSREFCSGGAGRRVRGEGGEIEDENDKAVLAAVVGQGEGRVPGSWSCSSVKWAFQEEAEHE